MEIELKFALTAEAARRVQAEWMEGARTRELVSTYFDTADRRLLGAGATLRLRRSGDTWVQTFKAGAAGAVARIEEEQPLAAGRLEPDRLPAAAREALRDAALADVHPVFESRVTRRSVDLVVDGARIELALDEGRLVAGDAEEALLEAELELASGDLPALFALGRRLLAVPGAALSLRSKAERGFRLADGDAAAPTRFAPPTLDLEGSAAAGFQALALAALHQLTANAERLRETPVPEAVHQARVALRRLKTFLTAFRRTVRDARLRDMRAAADRLVALFEDARALDVLETDTFRPTARHEAGAADFGRALLAARGRAYGEVQDAVRGEAFAHDVFELVEWVMCGPWTAAAALDPSGGARLEAEARRMLRRRWKVMRRRGRRLDWSDPFARHKLRIQGKKMRYLGEAFGAARRVRRDIRALKGLQDQLGALNDIATAAAAARLAYADASREAAFVAGAVVGERRAEQAKRIKAARRAYNRLVAAFGRDLD